MYKPGGPAEYNQNLTNGFWNRVTFFRRMLFLAKGMENCYFHDTRFWKTKFEIDIQKNRYMDIGIVHQFKKKEKTFEYSKKVTHWYLVNSMRMITINSYNWLLIKE